MKLLLLAYGIELLIIAIIFYFMFRKLRDRRQLSRMPLFEFRIKLRDRSVHKGVRQLDSYDLDYIYRTYLKKAEQHYRGDLVSFDVVMVSKL